MGECNNMGGEKYSRTRGEWDGGDGGELESGTVGGRGGEWDGQHV
jgi:hypothetical protein